MSTKLRSACDRCHESKVRCSGGIPCQGCLVSRSLCFYSVSNPLGRPPGTKKKQNREGSKSGAIWDRDGGGSLDNISPVAKSPVERGLKQRNRNRRSLINRKNSNINSSDAAQPDASLHSANRMLASGRLDTADAASRNESSFIPHHRGHHEIGVTGVTEQNDFHMGSLSPTNQDIQNLNDLIPQNFSNGSLNRYANSEVATSDFGTLNNPHSQNSISWDESAYNLDSDTSSDLQQSGAESLAFPDISRGYMRTHNLPFDETARIMNNKAQPPETSESNLPTAALTSLEHLSSNYTRTSSLGSASPKSLPAKTCNCLQRQAEILSNPILAEIRGCEELTDGIWSMDKALSLAKQAMAAWQNLLNCSNCPYNDDQEVMLLTFMSLRAVIQYLQRVSPNYTRPDSEASTPQSVREASCLRIGSFEVEGNDRIIVLRVLYENLLQNVKSVLHSLQMIQDKKKQRLLEKTQDKVAGVDDYQASSSLFHVQQISYGLLSSLQSLESSLKT